MGNCKAVCEYCKGYCSYFENAERLPINLYAFYGNFIHGNFYMNIEIKGYLKSIIF